jgi:Fic family protein
MKATYLYQLPDWPQFRWNVAALAEPLATVRHQQGRLLGRMSSLGFRLREEAAFEALAAEVAKSSEIEGIHLATDQVRSSVARRLGLHMVPATLASRYVEGVVDMMMDATQNCDAPLSTKRMFDWHAALFPAELAASERIRVGAWRDDRLGPMQVVSGPTGRERIHFQAPDASRLDDEMAGLIRWFNGSEPVEPVLKAALVHLWFVTIHPFDDGNGRIARAAAEMALARSEQSPQRFYSMSAQIRKERTAYYDILEQTQKDSLDITPWMHWFLRCLDRAIRSADDLLDAVLRKARFWESVAGMSIHPRQQMMLNRLLDGFEGKLTTKKWALISKTSHDTALRDIHELLAKGLLVQDEPGGRSTSYSLRP